MLSGMHRFHTTNRHSPILHGNRPSLCGQFTQIHQPCRLPSPTIHHHALPQLLCVTKINAAFRNAVR
eukprot:scaffold225765_cov53-Cyclotella_meneghiniana.AAC.3